MIFFRPMISSQLSFRLTAMVMIAIGTIGWLTACGDPKSQQPPIVVTFSAIYPPPSALDTGATAGIAAIVANDSSANASVNWTCIPSGQCGTFTPATIASNVPTQYLAPSAVPSGNTVTVTATSVTDPTKFISATITID
jgi:hypothetical protein